MANLPKATDRNYASVCQWLKNECPLSETEADVFAKDLDFVALVENEESKSVDGLIEDILTMMPCRRFTRVSSISHVDAAVLTVSSSCSEIPSRRR